MEKLTIIIISFIFFFIFNNFLVMNKILLNYSGSIHQKFSGITTAPLTGEFLFFFQLYLYFYEIESIIYLFVSLFILGLATDLKLIASPKIRFLIQTILLFLIVYFSDLRITSTRIYVLDLLISNVIFSYFFSTFCLLILINGSNFIDGLNGLLVGYFLLISTIFYQLDLIEFLDVENNDLLFFSIILFILFLLNLFKKTFMGDTGAYILGFFYGYILIKIYAEYQIFSFFLSYCFCGIRVLKIYFHTENLNLGNPRLIRITIIYINFYSFILKKYKLKDIFANNYGSLIVLLYNFIIFHLGLQNISNTQHQIIIILISILIYCFIYFKLFAYKYKLKV